MLGKAELVVLGAQIRKVSVAEVGDSALGPLKLLPGTWRNLPSLPGRGWNMIALPFATAPGSSINYRLLLNQYNESLTFTLVDKAVPNRGVNSVDPVENEDQLVVTLDYEQVIHQIFAEDFPASGIAGPSGAAIHHEPGLWLHMANKAEAGFDIARLSSIPHGDSVLALGGSAISEGAPIIPDVSGLPIGIDQSLDSPYMLPYAHFHKSLFKGLFDPTLPNDLLKAANQGVAITRTTTLSVDTTLQSGGISNIPFVVKQANPVSMQSTFWIQELEALDGQGNPKLRLQYSQVVLLEFPRRDGTPGVVKWPHVSINTMEKIL